MLTNKKQKQEDKVMKNKGSVFIMVILALLLISPLDVIPDFIPLVGLLDDILYGLGIFAGVLKMISERHVKSEPEVVIDAEQWDNNRPY